MAAAVNRVPFEIWLQIADLMGPAYSGRLYGVNRAWFEIAMNARYRVLDATVLKERVLSRLPLLREPGIAKRVQILSISGRALQGSLINTIIGHKVGFPMDRETLSIFNHRIQALNVAGVLSPQVQLLGEIAATLSPTEYSIKWDFHEGTPSGELIHASLQAAILEVAWRAFGSGLKKLNVSVRPERFHAVLSSDVRLESLKELHLKFLNTSSGAESTATFPESDRVSSFFTRLNPHLATLTIHFKVDYDLSSLFHCLPLLIHLRRLSLHIFLSRASGVHAGLESFLAHSSLKLRHLTVVLHHADILSAEPDLPSLAMARAHIPALETLDINFGLPQPALATTLLRELHDVFNGARETLHTLRLEGIALSYADLAALTSVFADRNSGDALQSLTISVHTLTANCIDTLARNAPHIRALGIIFLYFNPPDGPPTYTPMTPASLFKRELGERAYPEWKLRDISIWHRKRHVDTSRWDLVEPFPACVPSITVFFGEPVPQRTVSESDVVPRMLAALQGN
ncbi:hypothetical protein B0H16DRAFT_1895217 [Mycena metata]|uniref:Uncharacterized protein n=1 Tax=Mycena metata TaxID=1033252 RepID=A0AAD7H4B9_9AGAR|nr:hypothetical protein B0H16DRAFT_1900316 [Mycena metata]KAJ7725210.1 hypothetical protein B0H16DRAFT_1895217 [Mycena metata]